VPGQPATCEVRRRVGERADDEHPVERARAVEDVALDRALQGERHGREQRGKAGLDGHRDPVGMLVVAARAALGDRAREQLLDRPVDDRDDHEHHRPQQRDALVLHLREHVGGHREVGEGDDAGGRDADREDRGPAPVAAPRLGRLGLEDALFGRSALGRGRDRRCDLGH
jgi:hypothetical protein